MAYGALWGILTFFAGIGMTWAILPESLQGTETETWRIASWVWLNAHGVGVAGIQVGGLGMAFETVGFIEPNPELHALRIIPILLAMICALMVTITSGGASKDRDILEKAVIAVGGYMVAGLGVVVLSDARPGVGMIVVLMGVLGISIYLGSAVANALPIPVFAVTSISGLLGIGLLMIVAAGVVSSVAIPLGRYAVIGGVAATVSLWTANNLD